LVTGDCFLNGREGRIDMQVKRGGGAITKIRRIR